MHLGEYVSKRCLYWSAPFVRETKKKQAYITQNDTHKFPYCSEPSPAAARCARSAFHLAIFWRRSSLCDRSAPDEDDDGAEDDEDEEDS